LYIFFALSIIYWLFAQYLFVYADTHNMFYGGRGPYTDEGFYTEALRNYLNGFGFHPESSDSFLKTPLFSALLWLPLKLLGQQLVVARCTVIAIAMTIYIIIARNKQWLPLMLVLTWLYLFQNYLFHYSHVAIAEMLSVAFIVGGIYFLYMADENKKAINLVVANTFFIGAWLLKIQFLYVIGIPVIVCFVLDIVRFWKEKKLTSFANTVFTLGMQLLVVVMYGLLFYIPHKQFIDTVFNLSAVERIQNTEGYWYWVDYNYNLYFQNVAYTFYLKFFGVCLLGGMPLLFVRNTVKPVKFVYLVALLWFVLELHKIPMRYLPMRYLLSMLMTTGLLCSAVIYGYASLLFEQVKWYFKYVPIALLGTLSLFFVYKNQTLLWQTYAERKYAVAEANAYIKSIYTGKGPIIGNWAPALTWGIPVHTYPVSVGFLNHSKILTTLKPEIIISEPEQQDTGNAFAIDGVDFNQSALSVKSFKIGEWTVNIYKMKPDIYSANANHSISK
jgi:hypothetical protein